jgi:hypothetical protein
MRQPVFLGLRDDRDARHVVRERPFGRLIVRPRKRYG